MLTRFTEIKAVAEGPSVTNKTIAITFDSADLDTLEENAGYTLEVTDGFKRSVRCFGFVTHTEDEEKIRFDDWRSELGGTTIVVPKANGEWTYSAALWC